MNETEAKEKLLALKKKLEEIEIVKNRGINVFDAAGMTTQEIKHSAFLAWLFDPNKPHGLNGLFLQKFCESLLNYQTVFDDVKQHREIISDSLDDLDVMLGDKDLEVITENVVVNRESRIDIFIASPKAQTVIVIENKVFTSMHDDQLNRYEEELKLHPEYVKYKKVFVYLTPNGDSPYDEDWCIFDYGKILEIVKEIKNNLPRTKDKAKLKILLEDYIELVETNILKENKELSRLCKQILREHGEAVELLKNALTAA